MRHTLGNENTEKLSRGTEATSAEATSFSLPPPRPDFFRLTHLTGTLHAKYTKCSAAGCKCHRGHLHGPYFYFFRRVRGRLTRRYVRPEHVEAVRAACTRRQRRGAQEREWERLAKGMQSECRRESARLREGIKQHFPEFKYRP